MLAIAPMSSPPADRPRAKAFLRIVVLVGAEPARHVDEVREGVDLVQQLAVLVPVAAHLLAAADVRDGHDEAAIEQRQRGR